LSGAELGASLIHRIDHAVVGDIGPGKAGNLIKPLIGV
jgi:hypothetical protein